MAASTGVTIAVGAVVILDDLVSGTWDTPKDLRNAVATVVAAYAAAGLDKILPGLGTGLSVLALVAVVYQRGPRIASKILGSGPAGNVGTSSKTGGILNIKPKG